MARLVRAVDVAEGRRQEVAAPVTRAERLDRLQRLLGRRVQALFDRAGGALLLAAHGTNLQLEHDMGVAAAWEKVARDREVLLERESRAVPHVGMEQRFAPLGHPLGRQGEQRPHEPVELVLLAVVRVERDPRGKPCRHDMRELGERTRSGDHVLAARDELGAPVRDLHDSVALRVGEAAEGGDERLR